MRSLANQVRATGRVRGDDEYARLAEVVMAMVARNEYPEPGPLLDQPADLMDWWMELGAAAADWREKQWRKRG